MQMKTKTLLEKADRIFPCSNPFWAWRIEDLHFRDMISQGRNEAYDDSFDPVVLDKILIPNPEIFKQIDPWSQNYYWSHTPHSL